MHQSPPQQSSSFRQLPAGIELQLEGRRSLFGGGSVFSGDEGPVQLLGQTPLISGNRRIREIVQDADVTGGPGFQSGCNAGPPRPQLEGHGDASRCQRDGNNNALYRAVAKGEHEPAARTVI